MYTANSSMSDHRKITWDFGGYTRFRPDHARKLHVSSRAFLQAELAKPFDGPTVVVTHHALSARSLPEHKLGDHLSAAYASDLERLIGSTQPDLWIHGHIHESRDYALGDTRVVCNLRSYVPHDPNPDFDPQRVVEVGE